MIFLGPSLEPIGGLSQPGLNLRAFLGASFEVGVGALLGDDLKVYVGANFGVIFGCIFKGLFEVVLYGVLYIYNP